MELIVLVLTYWQEVRHCWSALLMKTSSVVKQDETQVRKVSETWANFRKGQNVASPGVSQIVTDVLFTEVALT